MGTDGGSEVRMLSVHHAAHTPLARKFSGKLAAHIERLLPVMQPPRCEVYLNLSGRRVPAGKHPMAFVQALTDHVTEPIQWDSCIGQMLTWGVRQFFECGPNRSLRFMMREYEHVNEAPFEVIRPNDFTVSFSV